ncbi:MAG: hypothetical protein PHS31_00120 [Victivallaceae bacterium]|nr:hypothetical protein [Victivallaceae bacterium]MDD4218551.1 hypothetical protein [Bacteroidales bacterium]
MNTKIIIVALSITLSLVANGEQAPDAVKKMFDKRAKLMLKTLGITEGSSRKFLIPAEKILLTANLGSLKIEDFLIKPSFGSNETINGFHISKDDIQKAYITIRTADSEQNSKMELGRWLVTSSMFFQSLLEFYKPISDIGEACVVPKNFNKTYGKSTRPNCCLYFVRNGIIMCINVFDINVNIEKLAKLIDQRLVKTHKKLVASQTGDLYKK